MLMDRFDQHATGQHHNEPFLRLPRKVARLTYPPLYSMLFIMFNTNRSKVYDLAQLRKKGFILHTP